MLEVVAELRKLLEVDDSLTFRAALSEMNTLMGISTEDAATLSVPQQVEMLVECTGLKLSSGSGSSIAAASTADGVADDEDSVGDVAATGVSAFTGRSSKGKAPILNQCEPTCRHKQFRLVIFA